jgi:hypothetical protein
VDSASAPIAATLPLDHRKQAAARPLAGTTYWVPRKTMLISTLLLLTFTSASHYRSKQPNHDQIWRSIILDQRYVDVLEPTTQLGTG